MDDTVSLSDLKDLVTAVEETSAMFNQATPWWRGHAKADWSLQAQVFRPEERSSEDEMALIGHFVSRAPSRSHRPCPDFDDHFSWLFLAQHYGLPTRLLDWSENPLVASFFAVLQEPNDDGCIWGMWPTGLNKAFGVPLGLIQIRDPKLRESAKSAFTGITPDNEAEALIRACSPKWADSQFTPVAHPWNGDRTAPIGCVDMSSQKRRKPKFAHNFQLLASSFRTCSQTSKVWLPT
jgi:FRG domain